ncbi:MAG: restriction endonuclease subunit S [Clostridia bacterium]|nr:restriction endonuclease subunit S [Clostridia bacterium]
MLKLSDRKWNSFFLSDVFTISAGKRLTKADMDKGNIPFIGATDSNNGITNWISTPNASADKNVLGVNYNGSVVENFYHGYYCVFSDDVKRLHLKVVKDNKYILLFFKTVILQQKVKYTYGYKFNGHRMERQKILVPVDEQSNPDYAFMEEYIKEREEQLIQKYREYIGKNTQTGGGTETP